MHGSGRGDRQEGPQLAGGHLQMIIHRLSIVPKLYIDAALLMRQMRLGAEPGAGRVAGTISAGSCGVSKGAPSPSGPKERMRVFFPAQSRHGLAHRIGFPDSTNWSQSPSSCSASRDTSFPLVPPPPSAPTSIGACARRVSPTPAAPWSQRVCARPTAPPSERARRRRRPTRDHRGGGDLGE